MRSGDVAADAAGLGGRPAAGWRWPAAGCRRPGCCASPPAARRPPPLPRRRGPRGRGARGAARRFRHRRGRAGVQRAGAGAEGRAAGRLGGHRRERPLPARPQAGQLLPRRREDRRGALAVPGREGRPVLLLPRQPDRRRAREDDARRLQHGPGRRPARRRRPARARGSPGRCSSRTSRSAAPTCTSTATSPRTSAAWAWRRSRPARTAGSGSSCRRAATTCSRGSARAAGCTAPRARTTTSATSPATPSRCAPGAFTPLLLETTTRVDLLEEIWFTEGASAGWFEGTVTEAAGKPAAGLYVLFYTDEAMSGTPAFVAGPTDAKGHFRVRAAAGKFHLLARSNLGGPLEAGEWYGKALLAAGAAPAGGIRISVSRYQGK